MSAAADEITRFLDTLAIDRKSRYTYRTPLRRFRAFAQKRPSAAGTPSIETLGAWLKREVARYDNPVLLLDPSLIVLAIGARASELDPERLSVFGFRAGEANAPTDKRCCRVDICEPAERPL